MKAAIFGGSGFVGSAVVTALRASGHEVTICAAPRLRSSATHSHELHPEASRWLHDNPAFVAQMSNADVVINAAGLSTATGTDDGALVGANALLPCIIGQACVVSSVRRLVHVSSAAVQGRLKILDETVTWQPFSPYSASKALGERAILDCRPSALEPVIYRPTSVHGVNRAITRALHRLAASPFSSVAGEGTRPSPQVLVESVGSAASFLAATPLSPPHIVMHPWEGVTTRNLLVTLGSGREPRRLPERPARLALSGLFASAKLAGRMAGLARRLEMLWFGQDQARSWLCEAGWTSPVQARDWASLAAKLSHASQA